MRTFSVRKFDDCTPNEYAAGICQVQDAILPGKGAVWIFGVLACLCHWGWSVTLAAETRESKDIQLAFFHPTTTVLSFQNVALVGHHKLVQGGKCCPLFRVVPKNLERTSQRETFAKRMLIRKCGWASDMYFFHMEPFRWVFNVFGHPPGWPQVIFAYCFFCPQVTTTLHGAMKREGGRRGPSI